ncbi:MAG TPA: PspC domain-containing protein, partial [Solirubrobacterales bacterium]|nr:PspC domain-containing protein [Solirubrobacterales bacterium]
MTGIQEVHRTAPRRLERDPDDAIIAGVCAAVAHRLGIDPIIVRVGFAIVCIATAGFAAVAYVIAWPFIPEKAAGEPSAPAARRSGERRIVPANWRVAGGVGLLTLSFLLVLRELGIWWSDALIWPLILASSGAALLWRQSRAMTPEPEPATGYPGAVAVPSPPRRASLGDLYRGGFGIALVVGAVLLFLASNDVLGDARDVVLTVIAAIAGLALILAPFLWRLGRNLPTERAERIRSQERAEL